MISGQKGQLSFSQHRKKIDASRTKRTMFPARLASNFSLSSFALDLPFACKGGNPFELRPLGVYGGIGDIDARFGVPHALRLI